MVTLTGLRTDDWQTIRRRMFHFHERVRKTGRVAEFFWCIERNEREGLWHVHELQHGDYLPHSELVKLWGQHVWINAVSTEKRATEYVVKGAEATKARYVVKGGSMGDLTEHRERNGGRLAHWSRKYMRNEKGEAMSAERLARELRAELDPEEWRHVAASDMLNELQERLDLTRAALDYRLARGAADGYDH